VKPEAVFTPDAQSEFENPQLAGVRSWRVSRFKTYLIFFRPIESGVEILHIAHGARDIERLFDE
jgi:toxin ParE1/3/4